MSNGQSSGGGFEAFLSKGLNQSGGRRLVGGKKKGGIKKAGRGLRTGSVRNGARPTQSQNQGNGFKYQDGPFAGKTMGQATDKAQSMYAGLSDDVKKKYEGIASGSNVRSDREKADGPVGGYSQPTGGKTGFNAGTSAPTARISPSASDADMPTAGETEPKPVAPATPEKSTPTPPTPAPSPHKGTPMRPDAQKPGLFAGQIPKPEPKAKPVGRARVGNKEYTFNNGNNKGVVKNDVQSKNLDTGEVRGGKSVAGLSSPKPRRKTPYRQAAARNKVDPAAITSFS